MIATVDAGNSTVNFGIFDGTSLVHAFYIPTELVKSSRKIDYSPNYSIKHSIYSSVVPEINPVLENFLKKWSGKEPLYLNSRNAYGIKIHYTNPEELGADRITHAYFVKYIAKEDSLVVDIGTAITIDVILKDGSFLGGAILASPSTVLFGLAKRTSKLENFQLDVWPETFIGKGTKECLRIGILYGTVGAILHISEEVENEIGLSLKKFLTGGGGKFFKEKLIDFHYNPYLNLEGLRVAFEEISKKE